LSDWYHTESTRLMEEYLAPGGNGNEPIPDAGLINGKGRFNCRLASPGASCTPNAPRENFDFVPGRRYRLRIINTSAFTSFKFSIDKHQLTVIEADMINVEPIVVDRLNINVAQRYSVIVVANAQPDNYWMRAVMSTACFPVAAPKLDRYVVARVHYQDAPDKSPAAPIRSPATSNAGKDCIDLDPHLLRPLVHKDVVRPNKVIQLDVTFGPNAQMVNRGYFNNVSYVPDFSRSMLEDLALGRVHAFRKTSNVYQVPFGDEVRLVITNSDTGEHPFHLHGHAFQILATGTGQYDPETAVISGNNPVRRDTATVPALGYLVLQFTADNIGLWLFHCHIESHVMAGLVATIQVGSARDFQRIHIPASVQRHCQRPHHDPGAIDDLAQGATGNSMQLAVNTRWSQFNSMEAPVSGAPVSVMGGRATIPPAATWTNDDGPSAYMR